MLKASLDLYRIFITAADAGSYTHAGNQLYMTQSAVSQAIKQLELQLNVQLFYRSGRGMALTSEGKTLYEHLKEAFSHIHQGEQALHALKNLEGGTLHIAASDTLCRHYLLPQLQQFHQKYPHIFLQMTNRPSPVCLEMVNQNQADLAFVNRSADAPPTGVMLENILEYEDCFIAGPAFEPYRDKTHTLKALLTHPLILLETGSSTRENLETWAKENHQTLTPGIEVGSVDLILDLCQIGLGIGWIPGYALKTAENLGLFAMQTKEKPPVRKVAVARSLVRPLCGAGVKFEELMRK